MSVEKDPFGRTYRARRLSDEETARRMIKVGSERVRREGLRVNFDLLRFEDLIAEAGVARSAVYRRWETKGHFYADLFLELAGYVHPAMATEDWETVMIVISRARECNEELRTDEGRRWLAAELCRVGSAHNFDMLSQSGEWSVYVALIATLHSMPDTDFHARLTEALGTSERRFLASMGLFYVSIFEYLGFRMRQDLGDITPVLIGQLGSAIVSGLSLNNVPTPELGDIRLHVDPFRTGRPAEWTLTGFGFASIALNLVEQDPAHAGTWSDERLAHCLVLLDELEQFILKLADENQLTHEAE